VASTNALSKTCAQLMPGSAGSVADMGAALLSMICDVAAPPTLWLGPGYAGYLGPALTIDPHSTAVACLAVGIDDRFTFRAASVGEVTARSAYSPARYEHQLTPRQGRMLFAFVEPTAMATVDYTAHMRRVIGPFGFDHRAEHRLVALCQQRSVEMPRIMGCLKLSVPRIMDPRIREAIAIIRADPAAEISAAKMAGELGLSMSYFLRLFGSQTATSFRRYKLWARMIHAAAGLAAGHDLTRCAVDAGFDSLSHFSRTFHSMFGLSPTALLSAGAQLVI
jgi:AraC-like DNA-binding protein